MADMPDATGAPIIVPPTIMPVEAREVWLSAAADWFRPMLADVGLVIPRTIRYAIAFPSAGKKGKVLGECWSGKASEDGWHNIIIRADQATALQVLEILLHECIHAALPFNMKRPHSGPFKRAALALGLLPPMDATKAGPKLVNDLAIIAGHLGTLPHARLIFREGSDGGDDGRPADAPRKQTSRNVKIYCKRCDYALYTTRKRARDWLPVCKADHGKFTCDALSDEEGDDC